MRACIQGVFEKGRKERLYVSALGEKDLAGLGLIRFKV